MYEPQHRILNPMLGLVSLYKKDGKNFKDVIVDVTAKMNDLGLDLTPDYINEKVLPWVLSFLFMTTSQQLLDQYIKNLQAGNAHVSK